MTEPKLPESSARRFWRNHRIKLGISFVIAAAFAWTLKRGGLPLLPPREAFDRISIPLCLAYVALLVAWTAVRAARWRHLLRPVDPDISLRRIVSVSYISFAAILIMPLRAGEVVRPYMIRQKSKISFAAATGTVGAERVIDGLALTTMLAICIQLSHPLDPLPDHIGKLQIPVATVPFYAYLAFTGFVVAFAVMSIFCWRPAIGRGLVEHTIGIVSKSVAAKVSNFVITTAEGLRFLPSVRHLAPFLFETGLYWGLNGLSMWVLARGCGIETITPVQAFVILGVLGVGIVVPAGPGLFGAFQASTYAGMAMYFHDDVVLGAGAVFVFVLYAIQCTFTPLAAVFFMIVDRSAAREAIEAENA